MRWFLVSLLIIASRVPAAEPALLEHLVTFLSGSFSNAEQARGDQNFQPATLHILPIWAARTDGPWIYGEQALAGAPAHPYRQFVFQLIAQPDSEFKVRIYDLPDPIASTGAWKEPTRLAALTPEKLLPREGCALLLRLQPDSSFKGGTQGRGCAGGLEGAAYSTIDLLVSSQQITIWERGFNPAGTQIRGSIHGGYAFQRVD